jgi:hypothetical protein
MDFAKQYRDTTNKNYFKASKSVLVVEGEVEINTRCELRHEIKTPPLDDVSTFHPCTLLTNRLPMGNLRFCLWDYPL